WKWEEGGAPCDVRADAKSMAKDREREINDVAAQYGGKSPEDAVADRGALKKDGRDPADVY
ncbi:sulfite reductase subunit alpha, partial [Methylobacterium sp. J-076]|nr:sulfite reductase subunit alpha [Methylobacterium sp. J-076]